jgi:hypothetical protein
MTISQRIVVTLFASAIFAISVFRIIHFNPGRTIPLTELVGALGALLLLIPFIWIRRLSTLHGTSAVAVPCISLGLVVCILWMSGNRILAGLFGLLSLWYGLDWIKIARNPKRRGVDDRSEPPKADTSKGA